MADADLPRLAVLLGPGGSLTPAEIARSARGLAHLVFLTDAGCRGGPADLLRTVAQELAPAEHLPFADVDAVMSALARHQTQAALTFVDALCPLVADLRVRLAGRPPEGSAWSSKERQRRTLRAAGVSRVRSTAAQDEQSLREFVCQVGFPIVVKPLDGTSSRDTWLIRTDDELRRLVADGGLGMPGAGGMLAEELIVGGNPPAPHLADYVSAEMFRVQRPGDGRDQLAPAPFVSDRLLPAWPFRETGMVLPSTLGQHRQADVIAVAERALTALGGENGAFHVEVKTSLPQPEIIEVNSRLGGLVARLARYGAGADVGRAALACGLGVGMPMTLEWKRCVMALLYQPPAEACEILDGPRPRDVKVMPGVLAVERVSAAGSAVNWREGTNSASATVWLEADDPETLRSRLIAVAEFLFSAFEYGDSMGRNVKDAAWLQRIAR